MGAHRRQQLSYGLVGKELIGVECVPNEDIPVLHNVNRGETIEHKCDRGYIEVTCNMTGTWNDKDIIPHDCCKD